MTGGLWDEPARPTVTPAKPVKKAATRRPFTEATRRAVVAAGAMDEQTGATRNARRGRCPDCGAGVWRGLDADTGARSADCDVLPLTALGEAMARFGGWQTLTLRHVGWRYQLDTRDQFVIAGQPAGSQVECDVLTVHVCGANIAPLPHGPSRMMPTPPKAAMEIDPPF